MILKREKITKPFVLLMMMIGLRMQRVCPALWSNYTAAKAYEKKDYAAAEEILLAKQAQKPHNPQINYNIGNVFYWQGKYDQAKESFKRAAKLVEKRQADLKEQARFNAGNAAYKKALALLGDDWESKEIPQERLDAAALEAKEAIDHYKEVISLNPGNTRAPENQKRAEELLQKIEAKKQQQQQQNQQQKNDSKEKDQNNKSEQKQQEKHQEKGAQNKRQPGNDEENKQDSQGGKEEKNQREQQEEKDEKGKKDDSKEEQQKQSSPNGQQEEHKPEEKSSDEAKKDSSDQSPGDQDMPEESQAGRQETKEGMKSTEQARAAAKEQQEENGAAVGMGEQEKDDQEKKGMIAILKKLDREEAALQKAMIMQQTKGKPPGKGGKNW